MEQNACSSLPLLEMTLNFKTYYSLKKEEGMHCPKTKIFKDFVRRQGSKKAYRLVVKFTWYLTIPSCKASLKSCSCRGRDPSAH